MGLANVAATIHAYMCDDAGFGYSWSERFGNSADPVTITVEGRKYTINRGDYDCSSSVITAWKKALEGTKYEGRLDGATYTGNMRSVFVNSGLFDVWDVNSTSAVRGDIYLNDTSHTAMCQDGGADGVYGYDALSEFCINEFGGTYGGQRGDQTGGESRIAGFYNYPWDCTLHYNGKADGSTKTDPDAGSWPLQMYTSNGTKAQKFKYIYNSDKTVSMQCVANKKFIDVHGAEVKNGTEVWLYTKNKTKAQKWKFVQKTGAKYRPAKSAPFEIVSALNSNYCLDVKGAGTEPGTTVQLYKRNGTTAQEWYRLDNGDGTWTLINNALGSKLVLDAKDGGK